MPRSTTPPPSAGWRSQLADFAARAARHRARHRAARDRLEYASWHQWRWITARLLIGLVIWLVVFIADPLQLYSYTTSKAAQIVSAWDSALYGLSKRKAQDEILVVLVTDRSVHYYNHGLRPMPLDRYELMIQSILAAKPRALFVDIGFERFHAGVATLYQRLLQGTADLSVSHPIPVFFGTGGPGAATMDMTMPAAIAARIHVQPVVTVANDIATYPLHETADHRSYDTAAFALYSATCAQRDCPPKRPELFTEDLGLTWGLDPPDMNRPTLPDPGCRPVGKHWVRRAEAGLAWIMPVAFPGVFAQQTQLCPYAATMDADLLDRAPEWASRHIAGRIILFGIDDPGDDFKSPFNGRMDGVYLHAMALDNLMTEGARYTRVPKAWAVLGMSLSPYRIISGGIWILIAILFITWDSWVWMQRSALSWLRRPIQQHRTRLRRIPFLRFAAEIATMAVRPVLQPIVAVLLLLLVDRLLFHWRLNEFLILTVLFPIYHSIEKKAFESFKRWRRGTATTDVQALSSPNPRSNVGVHRS